MAGSTRKDHAAISFFRVELDGIDSAAFRKCAGLKTETEVFEFQEGGDNENTHKLVGQTKASNIVLTKGFVSDPALFKWRDEIQASGTKPIKRRNGSIVALAADG
jgi:phage tail-like protein